MNTVKPDNFYFTMEGYIKFALNKMKSNEETRKAFMRGLRWAKDELTMEDARKYCETHTT